MNARRSGSTVKVAVIGGLIVVLILVFGTIWLGRSARESTESAVRSVSLLYLDELAGRREQVVAGNLQGYIRDMQVAIGLMDDDDLSDAAHLQAYQARMRQLYDVEKFAFVDANGRIYTADGVVTGIDAYAFDPGALTGPEISIKDLHSEDRKVVIAVPVDISFGGEKLVCSFMEIGMPRMLQGVSMQSGDTGVTFCNIYTSDGVALSNYVLGGLAREDNLLDAMRNAAFEDGYSVETLADDFTQGRRGVVSFTYGDIRETLSYVPVEGTNWLLTYLIRESVISERISSVTSGTIRRSLLQSVLTAVVLLMMFGFIIAQIRKNAQLLLEKETSETASRVKQQELEQRIALQDELLEQEKLRQQQDSMITALASDYRSVYHLNLDTDEAVCYREDPNDEQQHREGEHFGFHEAVVDYAQRNVDAAYREGFLKFIEPENIRAGLEREAIIAYRYLAQRAGREYYEMLRMAGVRHSGDQGDQTVHEVGLGFTIIDAEMRESMAKNQALAEALSAAEQANQAKTSFLSNMSHEIRTPMNAIIGLDSIALNDPELSPKTRGYLEKIGASADHLLNLINDILDMSRIESGRMTLKQEEFSFSRLLESVNTMFSAQCQERGLDYQCRIKGQVDDSYIGDNMKLRQVLINILSNAVKFTPQGGCVALNVRRMAQYEGRTTLRFEISDTGIGISEAFLPHIFDTFSQEDASTTNRYGSSGLGMAITKSIVEMMNGDIRVESQKGVGTTFTVTVTLTDSERAVPEADVDVMPPHDMSVLIVDDDPIACEHARLVLEGAGIAADVAESGARAIEMATLRHARRKPYHLILIDWKMPGMDGVEATRRIREVTGDESAIIILTAYRWDDVLKEALEAGVDSFIPKPLFAATVLEEFRSAVRRKGLARNAEPHRAELSGRRVLLAEDVQVNAEIMLMVLKMRNIAAELAENGRVAVDMFLGHPAGYYDAILMDMRMPEMDGLQATKAIRASDHADAQAIPIIALTANAFDEDVQRSLQAGLNAHLSKPVQPEALFETLESLIRD